VRSSYLGLVERKGTPKQVEQVVQETSEWLVQHPDDKSVRTAYLGLVERKGTPKQVEQVVQETSEWVVLHPNISGVWDYLISFLVRLNKIDEAIALAKNAISNHSRDSNLVTQYVKLIQSQLGEQKVREFYTLLMATYPRDTSIMNTYGKWLRSCGYVEEAEDIFKLLIDKAPRYIQARHSYGRLLLGMASYNEAADQFKLALAIHKGHQMAHDGLAQALCGLAMLAESEGRLSDSEQYFTESEREFRQAIHWAGIHKQQRAIFYTHLGWFYIDRKRWNDAIDKFEQAIDENPDFYVNYWGKGRSLVGMEQFEDARVFLSIALEKALETFEPPASEEIAQLLKECQDTIVNK
jgi:tetratricopeptide (TPR) repeat protein